MLVVIMALGMSGAQIALFGEKAARNSRDRQIALQAAEAALMDAETDIEQSPNAALSRSAMFSESSSEGFVEGCGSASDGTSFGLCLRASDATPIWEAVDFLATGNAARTVPYGHFTGSQFQSGEGPMPVRNPRYAIELVSNRLSPSDATTSGMTNLYRITAIGFGPQLGTQVLLQSFYRKPSP